MLAELMNEDFYDSFSLQLITDVNIAVAVEAIQAIGNLARGLRTHFSGSSRFLLPVLLVSSCFVSKTDDFPRLFFFFPMKLEWNQNC